MGYIIPALCEICDTAPEPMTFVKPAFWYTLLHRMVVGCTFWVAEEVLSILGLCFYRTPVRTTQPWGGSAVTPEEVGLVSDLCELIGAALPTLPVDGVLFSPISRAYGELVRLCEQPRSTAGRTAQWQPAGLQS